MPTNGKSRATSSRPRLAAGKAQRAAKSVARSGIKIRTAASSLRVPESLAQADIHRRTRKAHSLEVAEDYVETIADLMDTSGEARVVDIARRLGVTHVTVTRTIARLRSCGLVIAKPYRSIFLTTDGKHMAAHVRRRHEIVVEFLLALGLSHEVAHVDAEGIEHHVSKETLDAFERFAAKKR